MSTDQQTLGAAETWPIDQEAHVTSKSKTAGMRKSLTVEQERIRPTSDFFQDGKDRRRLAKRKQSGYVGKTHSAADHVLFNDRLRL